MHAYNNGGVKMMFTLYKLPKEELEWKMDGNNCDKCRHVLEFKMISLAITEHIFSSFDT